MKLRMLSVVVSALIATGAQADEHKEGVYLGVFGDYYNAEWENSRDAAGVTVDDSTGWGAELGYRFSKYWSGRIEYADMDFDLSGVRSDSVDGDRIGLDALYHFNGGPFYALAGLKSIDVFDSNTFVNVGAGYRHHFSDNFAANFETAIYQASTVGTRILVPSWGLIISLVALVTVSLLNQLQLRSLSLWLWLRRLSIAIKTVFMTWMISVLTHQ